MEISKGKWEIRNSIPQSSSQGDITVHTDQIIAVGINAELDLDFKAVSLCGRRGNEQAENHAKLIADAGNTYQSTNKLPSELAEANKELLEALSKFKIAYVDHCIKPSTRLVIEMEGLIKKHSNA